MSKYVWRIVLPMALLFVLAGKAHAQFETGKVYLGPHLGLGSYQSSVSFGGGIEYGLTDTSQTGPGRIGIGGAVDYWQWSGDAGSGYTWTYSWMPIHVFGAYHFELPNRKWDLFAGLGLGYIVVDGELDAPDGATRDIFTEDSYSSHLFWTGVAGARYFFTPGISAQARLGFGISLLAVGVDFTI